MTPQSSKETLDGHGRSRNKKWLLALVSLLFSIAAGELLLRAFRLAPQLKVVETAKAECVYQRSTNPILGFELKPNYSNPNPDYIDSYERTNAHGQRDEPRQTTKKTGVRRILLLGDSVVEGYGLPHTKLISTQLQAVYDNVGSPTEVLNFGVSAYCTLAEIELLATKGVEFDPDVVVLVFVENDFDNFNREAFPLGQSIDRPAIAEFLFRRSYLCRLVFLQFNLFHFRAEADPVAWNRDAISSAGGNNNVEIGLLRFSQLASEYNFEPVVAIWPRFEQDRIVDPHPIPGSEQLIVEALAHKNGIPSFRLSHFFNRELTRLANAGGRRVSPRLVFSQGDELHPSAEGTRIAAAAIVERLAAGFDQQTFDVSGSKDDALQAMSDQSLWKDTIATLSDRPEYSRVYNRIANDLLAAGKLDKAIEHYKKALEESPDNAATHNNLGIALERKKTTAEKKLAIEHYRKAIESRPDFAEAHYNLANAIEATQKQQAQTHYIKAIESRPDFVAAHVGLSASLLRDGRVKAAEAGFREILKMAPTHAKTLRLLGSELAKQKRFPEARTYLEQFVELDSNSTEVQAEALNNLGAICAMLNDREAAIRYLERAVQEAPNHPKATENLKRLKAAP